MSRRGKQAKEDNKLLVEGKVVEALPGAQYLVEVEVQPGSGVTHRMVGYLSGRMRQYYIKVVPGDKVRIELSPDSLDLGRIREKIFKKPLPEQKR